MYQKCRMASYVLAPHLERDPAFQMITITKETGLGLKILGGINRNEGPLVYIQEIIPGGDCYKIKTGYKKTEQTPITSSENSPADMSNTDIAPAWTDNYGPQGKKISLNPSVRLKAEKLEMALDYLGIQPTKEQQQALRQQVQIDPKGTVSFGDFVQVARNLFCLQLDEVNVRAREISSMLDSQLLPCDSSETDEIERLKRERNDALEEVNALKEKLFESERQKKQLTEELQNVKQEAKAVVEETRALRSRIHLAEAAQRQAHGMEMDYEEVIHLLETEITDLKAQLADCSDQNKESVQELRKRITVLDCQLRKSEMARKTFEASTEKLLHFVETIQELFSDNSSPLSSLSERPMLASQTSLTPLRRNGRNIPATLALESKELVKSVRAILDMDYLPYGWEEAYTADGIKYFIKCEFLSYEDQKSPLLEAYLTLLSWNELIRLYHLTASRHVHSLYPVSIKASSFGKPPLSPSGRWKKKKKGRNPFHFTKAKLS
ncbi:syntaxin-binding protein 4 isoform X16 [Canis lupus familiaris]|uniref:syntaxin-binding protein 4 isoform X16 n=1 Tax=Canis lupus familiaris TaxID=9615 RepID=UPI0018F74624|nr:syntaxin-binding protein 4 isoform X16 [Canis lupus familiaris]XP_038462704.1 syntaxin-binding protein 4 isoform X16 [Canis lupus familiaris]XP_038532913.1 syntaxin-binding protein 4 isoform X16 [Canis lupus familiaris]